MLRLNSHIAQFQHTAARRRLGISSISISGRVWFQHTAARRRLDGLGKFRACCVSFNTQPPEGGWWWYCLTQSYPKRFQHTAARRRLDTFISPLLFNFLFQHTAARRRLGARVCTSKHGFSFQHTAARRRLDLSTGKTSTSYDVSTHSRPKAAGRPRPNIRPTPKFQHTAARRRLAMGD